MLRCNCNELCFYYKKTSVIEIDGKKYTQVHNFNKCNRLLIENSKKKPCDFNSKILIEEKVIQEEDKEKIKMNNLLVADDKSTDKILTHGDIRNKIYDMFDYYYIKSSNYFGNLNYYLKLIGYHAHDPTIESLSELKTRLSKKPSNITKIYTNKESYFSHTIGEFDYDYDNEEQMMKRIKRGDDPSEWTKNEIVQDILKRKVLKHKKLTKSKKSNKSNKSDKYIKSHKVTSIEDLMNSEEDKILENEEKENDDKKEDKEEDEDLMNSQEDKILENEEKENDDKKEDKEEDEEEDEELMNSEEDEILENEEKENDDKKEDKEEDEEENDDEDDDKNSENQKDNEFDIEEFSDDDDNDYDDNNYDDFSD